MRLTAESDCTGSSQIIAMLVGDRRKFACVCFGALHVKKNTQVLIKCAALCILM